MKLLVGFLFAWCVGLPFTVAQTTRFVCYYPNWAMYRPGNGRFTVDDIDARVCTHYIYGFAILNNNTFEIEMSDYNADITYKGFEKFVALKDKNPNIKTMIAIGGWNEGLTDKYSQLAADSNKIAVFTQSVVNFLDLYKFDGLDMDWEYPYKVDTDKAGFINLMTSLKTALTPRGWLLSSAMAVNQTIIDLGYDLNALKNQVDFLNIMAYDMHGPWDDTVDNHSPLYKRSFEEVDNNNVDYIINYYIGKRIPKSKMNMGIPIYGKSWTLSTSNTSLTSPASGAGPGGPYTREEGTLAYSEICGYVKNSRWTVVQDPLRQAGPYAYSPATVNKVWVGYDDMDMAKVKTDYAVNNELGGVMLWDISFDDFHNDCGDGPNPIIRTVYCAVNPENCSTETTTSGTGPTSVTGGSSGATAATTTVPSTIDWTVPTTSQASTSPSVKVTTTPLTRGTTAVTEPGTTKSTMAFPPYKSDGTVTKSSGVFFIFLSVIAIHYGMN